METFDDATMRRLLASSLKTAKLTEARWEDSNPGPGSAEGDYVDWLTISDNAASVVAHVTRSQNHPWVSGDIPIYGYLYDVGSGQLVEIPRQPKRANQQFQLELNPQRSQGRLFLGRLRRQGTDWSQQHDAVAGRRLAARIDQAYS